MDGVEVAVLAPARPPKPAILIAPEVWTDFWPSALPLMKAHREELRQDDPRAPLVLDHSRIEALEAAGGLLVLAARHREVLVGYSIWYLVPSLESRGLLVAFQAPWYVSPAFRGSGCGLRLLSTAEAALARRGVRLVSGHLPEAGPGAELWPLFARKGAKRLGIEFTYWLPEAK